jgi:hypothetical protein
MFYEGKMEGDDDYDYATSMEELRKPDSPMDRRESDEEEEDTSTDGASPAKPPEHD